MTKCDGRIETDRSSMEPCPRPATWVLKSTIRDAHYCSSHKAWETRKARRHGHEHLLRWEPIAPSRGAGHE